MKRTLGRISLALSLCLLAGVGASAKVKNRTVAFAQDFTVAGTPVKGGIYRVSFDDKTGELTFADNKTKAVVAKVAARAESRQRDAMKTDVQLVKHGDSLVLTGIAFSGENRVISIGEATADAAK